MDRAGYIKISRKVMNWEWFRKPETLSLFLTLIILANWEDGRFQGQEIKRGQLLTSYQSLSWATGLSEKQIRTSLDRLEKTGEIRRERAGKGTLITVENYTKYQDGYLEKGRETADEGQIAGRERAVNEEFKELSKNSFNNNICAFSKKKPPKNDPLFDAFWSAYPKKKSKEAARKAFIRIKPDEELLQTMLTALEAQKNSTDWTKDNGQFIPYPATWLNGHRWEDEEVEQLSELEKWVIGQT